MEDGEVCIIQTYTSFEFGYRTKGYHGGHNTGYNVKKNSNFVLLREGGHCAFEQ